MCTGELFVRFSNKAKGRRGGGEISLISSQAPVTDLSVHSEMKTGGLEKCSAQSNERGAK
jgi:hypothetical protein